MLFLSLCVFLQAVSVGKHVKGYHYIIANLVSKPRLSIFPDRGRDEYEMQRRLHVYVF